MKRFKLAILFIWLLPTQPIWARTVVIDVYGMTCGFCADGLERQFKTMKSVARVQVSLRLKKIRLETQENEPSLEKLKKAVLDAGFTPTKITVLTDEKE